MPIQGAQGRRPPKAKIKDESGEVSIGTSGNRKLRMRRNNDSGMFKESDLRGMTTQKTGRVFGGSSGGASVYIAKD